VAGLTAAMADALTNPDVPTAARRLMRGQDRAALGSLLVGAPYVSLVLVAVDLDATPLLLLSDLAQHTRNLAPDARVSLLFDGTGAHDDPLAGPRLTVLGRAEPSTEPRQLARFVARHPSSAVYAGFGDFHVFRVIVERGHMITGFGRIDWIAGSDLRLSLIAEQLAAAADEIVGHMNAEHADAVALYAHRLLGRGGEGWQMTGIDPEGIDLRRAAESARLDFVEPVLTPQAARAVLIALAQQARAAAVG
jgi:heme oxygenase (biliverdin-IX-beta and delta-forming)